MQKCQQKQTHVKILVGFPFFLFRSVFFDIIRNRGEENHVLGKIKRIVLAEM